MPRSLFLITCLIIALTPSASERLFAAPKSTSTPWQAGTGRERITPEESMPMAGYASRGAAHATGKIHDLWAKALLLEDAYGNRCALVTLDLCGIDDILAERICDQLKANCNLERHQIMLATSHTHSGPVVAGNLRPMHYMLLPENDRNLVDRYAQFLVEKIKACVQQAARNLAPSTLSFGSGNEDFAVNRRSNVEKDVPALRAAGKLAGPTDPSVPVLVISQANQPVAVIFGYACHCTTLSGMDWCGDYAGFAQIELEKKLPGCTALFWAGCGGDQNPLPRRTVELASEYGHRLASAVRSTMENKLAPIESKLRTRFNRIAIPFATLPTREQIELNTQSENRYEAARAQALLRMLDAGESLPTTYSYPVATWRLGNSVDWVALGGEVVVDYALSIKALNKSQRATWITAYANDVMAYIPSRRVLTEGGYEGGGAMVYYGRPAVWAPEIEQLILDEVTRQLTSP